MFKNQCKAITSIIVNLVNGTRLIINAQSAILDVFKRIIFGGFAMSEKLSTRDKILELLEANEGVYLSGEEIAARVGISRTAVWKAVKKLQENGYTINAVTKRGYCLVGKSDVLSEKKIRSYMHPEAPGIIMDVYGTVDSTNTVCLKRISGEEHTLDRRQVYAAIAGAQTQGRGRRGRSFFSPDGTGLYMSILLRPAAMTSDQAMRFTTIAAVATAEAIEAVSARAASIKWVNDIYVDGRKVCGILTEASFNPEDGTLDYAVVGIGINVYEPVGGFPDDISDRAGSVTKSNCEEVVIENGGRNRLAAEILSRFFSYLADFSERYVEEYKRRCFVTGMDVDVVKAGAEPVSARVLGVDDECHLMVRYEDGTTETLSSGEISIRL